MVKLVHRKDAAESTDSIGVVGVQVGRSVRSKVYVRRRKGTVGERALKVGVIFLHSLQRVFEVGEYVGKVVR